MSDKVVVTNKTALRSKYKDAYPRVEAAIRRLLKADAARGLDTRLIAVDSKTQMRAVKGRAVTDAGDRRQAKDAIDAIYKAHTPDYLVILGAPDVIPHQELPNPVEDEEEDKIVPSDLPYACAAPFSRDPAD